jgi:hypothetical protein
LAKRVSFAKELPTLKNGRSKRPSLGAKVPGLISEEDNEDGIEQKEIHNPDESVIGNSISFEREVMPIPPPLDQIKVRSQDENA